MGIGSSEGRVSTIAFSLGLLGLGVVSMGTIICSHATTLTAGVGKELIDKFGCLPDCRRIVGRWREVLGV